MTQSAATSPGRHAPAAPVWADGVGQERADTKVRRQANVGIFPGDRQGGRGDDVVGGKHEADSSASNSALDGRDDRNG